jgi:hypothetical protein
MPKVRKAAISEWRVVVWRVGLLPDRFRLCKGFEQVLKSQRQKFAIKQNEGERGEADGTIEFGWGLVVDGV